MSTESIHLPRRYPGLKPFERSQSAVFHGRKDDIMALTNLILRERLVVLFAKSGIGKTSILQAGCAPELEKQDFVPIFLRTEKTSAPIVEAVSSLLEKSDYVSGQDETSIFSDTPKTLWELVKRLEFDLSGMPATPVLVLDQFEETFTLSHSEQSRVQFLEQLADVANGTMPEILRKDLIQRFQNGEIDVKTMQWWEKQPELRVVISIRSDFLHLMDSISTSIPNILRNRYQLKPLDREKARIAIVQPAMALGQYASNSFTYSDFSLNAIISFLAGQDLAKDRSKDADDMQMAKKQDEIETVNLQIVCQDIEERVIDYQKPDGFEVETDFFEGAEGLRSSIRNFYANQLDAFARAYADRIEQKTQQKSTLDPLDNTLLERPTIELRLIAQRLVEESLITSGNRRNSVVDDTLLDEYKITPDFLDTLVDKSRLLRKEPRLNDFYYEISHDTLLPAIIESRNKRRNKERSNQEKIAYEAKLAEEARHLSDIRQQLDTTLKQRKLARTVALLSFISLLFSLAFAVWFIYDYIKNAHDQVKHAKENIKNELFGAAIRGYEDLADTTHPWRNSVLKNTSPRTNIHTELQKTRQLKELSQHTDHYLHLGDDLFFKDDYANALLAFHRSKDSLTSYNRSNYLLSPIKEDGTQDLMVDSAQIVERFMVIGQRIENARRTLIREFIIAQRDFEVFQEARVTGQARRHINRMKQLLPTNPSDLEKLQTALGLDPKKYVSDALNDL